MELFRVVCITRPDTDRPAPAMMAASTRGMRMRQMIRDSASLPLPINAPKASEMDRLEEPINSPPTPQITTAASMASRTRVFLRFRFCN